MIGPLFLLDSTFVSISSGQTRSGIRVGSVSRYTVGLSALLAGSGTVISVQNGGGPLRSFSSWKRVLLEQRGSAAR